MFSCVSLWCVGISSRCAAMRLSWGELCSRKSRRTKTCCHCSTGRSSAKLRNSRSPTHPPSSTDAQQHTQTHTHTHTHPVSINYFYHSPTNLKSVSTDFLLLFSLPKADSSLHVLSIFLRRIINYDSKLTTTRHKRNLPPEHG